MRAAMPKYKPQEAAVATPQPAAAAALQYSMAGVPQPIASSAPAAVPGYMLPQLQAGLMPAQQPQVVDAASQLQLLQQQQLQQQQQQLQQLRPGLVQAGMVPGLPGVHHQLAAVPAVTSMGVIPGMPGQIPGLPGIVTSQPQVCSPVDNSKYFTNSLQIFSDVCSSTSHAWTSRSSSASW